MHFALLLSDLPRVEQSRVHYDAMLSLDTPQAVCGFRLLAPSQAAPYVARRVACFVARFVIAAL